MARLADTLIAHMAGLGFAFEHNVAQSGKHVVQFSRPGRGCRWSHEDYVNAVVRTALKLCAPWETTEAVSSEADRLCALRPRTAIRQLGLKP